MDPKQVGAVVRRRPSPTTQPFLHAYDDAPMWKVEPRNLPYRDSLETSHLPGWPAPLSRAQSESVAKYVVIDMFAKACAGKSTKEVIADAEAQLKQIYKHGDAMTACSQPALGSRRRAGVLACDAGLEREGVFSWLMVAPPVALPGGAGRLSVLLRHLAQPARTGRSPSRA